MCPTLDFLRDGPPSLIPVMSAGLAIASEKLESRRWVVGTSMGIPLLVFLDCPFVLGLSYC